MGYAKGIRAGHTWGHFKEPILNALKEWLSGDQEHWSDCFGSEKNVRKAVGRLRHCKDILPSMIRELTNEAFDPAECHIGTYGQLAKAMIFDLDFNSKRPEARELVVSDLFIPKTKALKKLKKEIGNETSKKDHHMLLPKVKK